jgi:hypothetical protein
MILYGRLGLRVALLRSRWIRCATHRRSTAPNSAHLGYAAILCRAALFIIAAPLSAIMIVGAFVLVDVTVGITEASMTRRPSIPCTRNVLSTTLVGCKPIMQVQLASIQRFLQSL